MAQYSDYLKYLQHVDDTTVRDMENRENALRNEFNEKLAGSEQQYQKARNEMKFHYENEIRQLRELNESTKRAHEAAVNDLKLDYDNRMDKLLRQSESENNSLKEVCQIEIDRLNEEKRVLMSDHASAVDQIKYSYESRLSDAKLKFNREKSDLVDRHREEVSRLNNEIKRKEEEFSAAEANLRNSIEVQTASLKKHYEQEKRQLLVHYSSKLKELEQNYTGKISQLNEDLEKERDEAAVTISDLNNSIAQLEKSSEVEVRNSVAKVTDTYINQLKSLKAENSDLRYKLNDYKKGTTKKRLVFIIVAISVLFLASVVWGLFFRGGSGGTKEILVTETDTVYIEKKISDQLTAGTDQLAMLEAENENLKKQLKDKDAVISKKDARISSLKKEVDLLNEVFNR